MLRYCNRENMINYLTIEALKRLMNTEVVQLQTARQNHFDISHIRTD